MSSSFYQSDYVFLHNSYTYMYMKKECKYCGKDFESNISVKKFCGKQCKSRHGNKLYNRGSDQKSRGAKKKSVVCKKMGGKCCICGYSKNLSGLTFHHTIPQKKLFPLDIRSFANRKKKALEEEVQKCILVCRNCHSEIEHPQFCNWQEKW